MNGAGRLLKREEWKKRVAECRESGLSIRRWSVDNGFRPRQLYDWIHRLKARGEEQPTTWVQAIVGFEEAPACESGCGLLVRIGKACVEVKPGFDPELLCSVVRALSCIC